MRPVIDLATDTAADHLATTIVFADGIRCVVLVMDRALARDRLTPRIIGQAVARAWDAASLEAQLAQVAESLGWSVQAEAGATVDVLTVGRA